MFSKERKPFCPSRRSLRTMRGSVLTGLCVAAVVLCVYLPQPCEAQWQALVGPLIEKVSGLWHNDTVDFMGRECKFRRSPKIKRWELYHEGKFWCPGWAPFSGNSSKRSRSGSLEEATRDFVRQAFEKGLITEADAKLWLKI